MWTSAPDHPLDAEQRTALFEIVDALRGLIEASVSLNASREELAALAAELHGTRQRMEAWANNRGLEPFNPQASQLDDLLPTSPITGPFNPIAPPLKVVQEGERVLGRVTLGNAYEGPPGCVHGAMIAAIYDQLLAIANIRCGAAGPTAQLNVSYHRPTPLHQPLEFTAWVAAREGRKITLHGECHANGERVTSCEALFIHFAS